MSSNESDLNPLIKISFTQKGRTHGSEVSRSVVVDGFNLEAKVYGKITSQKILTATDISLLDSQALKFELLKPKKSYIEGFFIDPTVNTLTIQRDHSILEVEASMNPVSLVPEEFWLVEHALSSLVTIRNQE